MQTRRKDNQIMMRERLLLNWETAGKIPTCWVFRVSFESSRNEPPFVEKLPNDLKNEEFVGRV